MKVGSVSDDVLPWTHTTSSVIIMLHDHRSRLPTAAAAACFFLHLVCAVSLCSC
jgi:hypothetical protein